MRQFIKGTYLVEFYLATPEMWLHQLCRHFYNYVDVREIHHTYTYVYSLAKGHSLF